MNSEELEVQRLKDLVKDLELQNSALRSSQKQTSGVSTTVVGADVPSNHPARRSLSSDGEDEFFDLSSMGALDDDISWLYSSPVKPQSPLSEKALKKDLSSVFECAEMLPRRRALSHKLKDIGRGNTPPPSLFPLTNGSTFSSPKSSAVISPSSHTNSMNSSYTSDGQSSSYTSAEQTPDDKDIQQYMNSVMGSQHTNSSAPNSLLADQPSSSQAIAALPQSTASTGYNSGTFTRPKKKQPSSQPAAANSNTADLSAASSSSSTSPVNVQPNTPKFSHDNLLKYKKTNKKCGDDMAAGDSATFVLTRNKTRTIESSAVLEAQKRLTDSSSSLDQSDSDSVGALPGKTFKRRVAVNQEDKSKRESLDIQTLAKLQEQSLRDSLTAVRKASTSSAGSNGVPGLSFSDLDSSTGSLSSNNEDAFHQHTEEKAVQGSGTFRIRKSPRHRSDSSPTLEHNGDTPILHKSVVNSRTATSEVGSGRRSPQIRSSLSPRSLQTPKTSGLRKPNSALPTKTTKPRSGGIPVPAGRTGLRPPTATQYSSR